MSGAPAHGPLRRRLGETRNVWKRAPKEAPLELPLAQIDEPKPGKSLERGFVHVSGWALAASGPVDRIELIVNGELVTRARLGVARPDLPKTFDSPYSRFAGFTGVLDLSRLPRSVETVKISGRAFGREGEAFNLPIAEHTVEEEFEEVDPDPRRSALLRDRSLPAPSPETSGPRILAVTHDIALGGGQLVMLELLRRFSSEHGMTGSVVAPQDGATRPDLEAAGYEVHVTGAYPVKDVETYEGRMAELVAWAGPRDFDLVLVNTVLAFPGGDLASRLGLPAIWIVHESYGLEGFWATYQRGGLHPYVRERGSVAFGESAATIFEVDATRELFRESAGDSRLLTLPYGIDIAAIDRQVAELDREEVRANLGYEADDFVILCMGTIEPRKGQVQLVEAFARISDEHPRARLVMVGAQDNRFDREVRLAAKTFGVEDRVDVHPVTPEITPFYLAADMLVCASDIESLPRTVLEAMAMGLPVMATDVFGLPEVIDDGVTGWIVESRDTGSLSRGLAKAVTTPEAERTAIAAAARKLVESEHDSPACAAKYAEVIRDVLSSRGDGSLD